MAEVFIHLLNMSITASWLILAILILRLLLKKAPKWTICLMWCLVGIRLLVPVSIESMFSLIPRAEVVSEDILYDMSPAIDSGIHSVNQAVNPILQENFAPTDVVSSVNPLQIITYIAANIWILGMGVLLVYTLVTYVQLRRRVGDAIRLKGNIYQSEKVGSPFVLGIVKPRIYVPFDLPEEELSCVIAHEQAHIKRRDHLLKPIAFLVLTVYWFNPLVWVAYILLCRDIEYACDEKVLKELGAGKKKIYSEALLRVSVSGNVSRKMIAACPIAFGEVGVKSRIKGVLHYKKPAFWIVIAALLACVVCIVCFMTNPREDGSGDELSTAEVTASVFALYGIDVSEISCEDIEQISIYADGYYGRSLEQPLLVTEQEQIEKILNLANPSTQKYEQIEGSLEGLCGVFVDFGNGIVFSMYADTNYGLIGDGMRTTGNPYVRFPQELYDEVITLLQRTSDEAGEQEAETAVSQRFKAPPTMLLQDALSSTMEHFAVTSGTYNWGYPSEEEPGMMTSTNAEGRPPAAAVKGQEWLNLKKYNGLDYATYVLSFEVMPDYITVRDYDLLELGSMDATVLSETGYETASEELFTLELSPRRIYEVVAEWEQEKVEENGFFGTASYAFATDDYMPEAEIPTEEELALPLGEKFTEEVNTLGGVSMYMEKYKETEGEVEFVNDNDREYQYGEYYDIQAQKDGEWYSLQTKNEVAYESIAILLPAGSGTVWEVNWEYVYGALPEGKYRIVKDIMDYRAPGDYTKYYLAAEFEIMLSQ